MEKHTYETINGKRKRRDKAGERLHRYRLPSLVLIASVSSHTPSPLFSPPPSLLIAHIISLHSLIDHASSLHSLFPIASSTLPHPLSPTPHCRDLSLPSSPTLIAGTSLSSLNAHPHRRYVSTLSIALTLSPCFVAVRVAIEI
ncbi:hypothetical protein IGI04_014990 [Brassica rapa subsp. trilocularis]|uniref:MADS-box domain-containing protein n=1 Tax=Brassica rapa subsp. trilocularis TaxID=1813537 RepID=A0ABQ7MNR8_BRACM|nr:hypothetical protein IGI04_014990 [Brassica rapa subsp. trilocularis]